MKGFLFSFDALLAALVLIGGLVLISTITDQDTDTSQLVTASEDTVAALGEIAVSQVQDPWVIQLVANGTITDQNVSVLEQIGKFWATGQASDARRLAGIMLNSTYQGYGLRLTIDDDTLYERNSTKGGKDVLVSTRMISGIAEGQAITGSSASAYLKRIRDKRTSAFLAFGGFVGQGNVSARFLDLPADSVITNITLELSVGAPFTVFLNGAACGGTRTPTATNGTPDRWDLTSCNGSLAPGGMNNISINFSRPLNVSYITGGYLRVKYRTETLRENISDSTAQYRFPGISGIVNLYDAFYVPGTLTNMTIYLHYNASNSTYLQIGEKRVWEDDPNGTERRVFLNDSYLLNQSLGKLDYEFLSNKTVPIRMAGFAPNQTVVTSGDADIVLITDFSGSMKKAVIDWDQGNLGSDCANAYNDDDVRRTLLAQCVDKVFVDNIMNYSGNRIWPVFIYENQVRWYNNPTDANAIKGYIDSYANGKDKTCYACALNLAYDILANHSGSGRKRFIVFMTDGVPTHCASGGCTSNSIAYGTQQCAGLCDTAGACDASNIPTQCSECTTNNAGQGAAYYAANRSVQAFNATIYTVGFGPVGDCSLAGQTLQEIAEIGNGTYQHSNDSGQLKLIYENISQEILTKTTLVAQVATVDGPQSTSVLFDDSYINVTYVQAAQYEDRQNALSLALQSDPACDPVLTLYAQQELVEAQALSYSGVHWSDFLAVNGVEAYNLSTFLLPYDLLGDPTLINAPLSLFAQGNNTFTLDTGDSATNRTGCIADNSVLYTVLVNLSTERSTVVPNATGCTWIVQFEDDTFDNITIPSSYAGTQQCSYRAGNITYDANDAYQVGAYQLLQRLDFRNEGKLFVNLRDEDLEIIVTTISGIPYLWGPTIVKLEVIR